MEEGAADEVVVEAEAAGEVTVTVAPTQHPWAAVAVGRKLPVPGASVHPSIRHLPWLLVLQYLHLGVRGMGVFQSNYPVALDSLAGILDFQFL